MVHQINFLQILFGAEQTSQILPFAHSSNDFLNFPLSEFILVECYKQVSMNK